MMVGLLVAVVATPGPTAYIFLEILSVTGCGLIYASRIWYLGRRNFIDPLMKIFARFDSFDPRAASAVLPPDSNPLLARFTSVVNDLSARIQAYERELTHAVFQETEKSRYKALGQISALVAHDLSSPLHVVHFCATSIADNPELAREERYVSQLRGNAQRAVELIDSLRAYLKGPRREDHGTAFWKCHHNVLRILRVQYEQNAFDAVTFEVKGDASEVSIAIPRQDLIHVLMNIYKNSVDNMISHAVPAARLRVGVMAITDGAVRVEIEDNGTGLTYARYEEMTGHESVGTLGRSRGDGLGLRLVRRLVEQYDGSLTLDPDFEPGTRLVLVMKRGQS